MCSTAAHLHERGVYRLDCCCVSSSYTTTAHITSETNDGLYLLINNVLCVCPLSRPHKSGFILSYDTVPLTPHLRSCSIFSHPVLLRCWKHKHWSLLFVRTKPVEQLSPTQSPSDWEAKFERKKSQPSHVGTQSPVTVLQSRVRFFSPAHTSVCSSPSYQRRTLSITSCSRRSAKTSCSGKVSSSSSVNMNMRSGWVL